MKKIKSKTVRDYVMNDVVWKVDLPAFLKCTFNEVFENRTFVDGLPFGVKLEE